MNLKLGGSGDLVINRGAERTSGLLYTGQLIQNRLKTLKGEWELNKTIGLPWFTDLLKHSYNINLIYSWINKTLVETPNVTGVSMLTLGVDKTERILLVSFEVETIYGLYSNKLEV